MANDAHAEKPTKAHAVFLALQELGKDAPRGQIQTFVKDRFGIDMEISHVSTARTDALKKPAGLPARKKKKTPAKQVASVMPAVAEERPAAAKKPVTGKPQSSSNGTTIQLEDIVALKALVKRVGADNLKSLIDVIGR